MIQELASKLYPAYLLSFLSESDNNPSDKELMSNLHTNGLITSLFIDTLKQRKISLVQITPINACYISLDLFLQKAALEKVEGIDHKTILKELFDEDTKKLLEEGPLYNRDILLIAYGTLFSQSEQTRHPYLLTLDHSTPLLQSALKLDVSFKKLLRTALTKGPDKIKKRVHIFDRDYHRFLVELSVSFLQNKNDWIGAREILRQREEISTRDSLTFQEKLVFDQLRRLKRRIEQLNIDDKSAYMFTLQSLMQLKAQEKGRHLSKATSSSLKTYLSLIPKATIQQRELVYLAMMIVIDFAAEERQIEDELLPYQELLKQMKIKLRMSTLSKEQLIETLALRLLVKAANKIEEDQTFLQWYDFCHIGSWLKTFTQVFTQDAHLLPLLEEEVLTFKLSRCRPKFDLEPLSRSLTEAALSTFNEETGQLETLKKV